MNLILASGSPRRRELMSLITPDYTVITSDVDETKIAADSPAHLAKALATAKARAVAEENPDDVVCGFDTVVECEGEVFGKPKDEADAMRMLNENAPNDQVIKLKALEAFQKAADGKATKIIIPSEIQGLAGLAASAKTLLESDPPQE